MLAPVNGVAARVRGFGLHLKNAETALLEFPSLYGQTATV